MTSKSRVRKALRHEEPDKVPLGIYDGLASGIHHITYRRLRDYLDLKKSEVEIFDRIQQLALLEEDFKETIKTDVEGIFTEDPAAWTFERSEDEDYYYFKDEFGITWRKPKEGGLYYDMYKHPLQQAESVEEIEEYSFIDPADKNRFVNVEQDIKKAREKEKAIIVNTNTGGMFELALWIRGFAELYMDMAGSPEMAETLLDKTLDYKLKYWDAFLDHVDEDFFIVAEADDIASQNSTLISPQMYREFIKPRHKKLFKFIKDKTDAEVYIFYHSCGAVKNMIPDLIEEGVDILNPVQLSAKDMNPGDLKAEFGSEISFWGGGIDTQRTLPQGSIEEVKEETRYNIEQLAPGGGFIFVPVHNVQADVSADNFMAMWETLQEYGDY